MKHRIFKFSHHWYGMCHRCSLVVSSPLWRLVAHDLEDHIIKIHVATLE